MPKDRSRSSTYSGLEGLGWVLRPPSNSWIIIVIGLYIALNRTPNIDCYLGGQYPRFTALGLGWSYAKDPGRLLGGPRTYTVCPPTKPH